MTDLQKQQIKATTSIVATAFFGAVLAQLEQMLSGGIPPESQWKHDAFTLIVVGLAAVYHRYKTTPTDAIANDAILSAATAQPKWTPKGHGFVRVGLLFRLAFAMTGGLLTLLAVYAIEACNATTAGVVISALPVIEGAVCKIASEQPNDPAWVEDICAIPLAPASTSSATPSAATTFRVRVPKEQNAAFLALHSGDAGGAR